jgi:hypothetical protein
MHTIVFDFKYDGFGSATLRLINRSGLGQGATRLS